MAYLDEAHQRFLHGLAKATPVNIPLSPSSEHFEDQAKHVQELRSLFVEYLHSLATDGASNSTGKVINSEVTGYVGDAMSDFAGQFSEVAEGLREDEPKSRSDYAEHNTFNRAQQGVA